jgi:hypothetical protein
MTELRNGLFIISHARVSAFRECPRKYWYAYVSEEEWPEDLMSPPGIVGIGVHRGMRDLCVTGNPALGRRSLEVYLKMPSHREAGPGTAWYEQAMTLFEAGVRAHATIAAEESWAELVAYADWPSGGVVLETRADRVDRLSADRYQVVDWKTGHFEYDDETDDQLDIAHVAARRKLKLGDDVVVRAIAWNLRAGPPRVRELEAEDADWTLERMAALAGRIRAETAYEAAPGPPCRFCRWHSVCPEAAPQPGG